MRAFTLRINTARIAEAAIGILFAFAAASKVFAPPGFLLVCRYLFADHVGQAGTAAIAILIVAVESAIGVRFLLGNVSRRWLWFAFSIVAAFSVALVVLVRDPLAPPCACLGITHLINRANSEAPLGLVRNGAIFWLLGLLLYHQGVSGRQGGSRSKLEVPSPSSN